jgi:ribosomal protein S4
MSRHTRPKARVNRRLGVLIYESSGAKRASERRENPPGMHTRPKRTSNYGTPSSESNITMAWASDNCVECSTKPCGSKATRAKTC